MTGWHKFAQIQITWSPCLYSPWRCVYLQVMPYSWKLSTTISNNEASENYKEVNDPAVMVSLIATSAKASMALQGLAWTKFAVAKSIVWSLELRYMIGKIESLLTAGQLPPGAWCWQCWADCVDNNSLVCSSSRVKLTLSISSDFLRHAGVSPCAKSCQRNGLSSWFLELQ